MKKIIATRSVLHSLGCQETIFGRGNITTYPVRTAEELLNVHGVLRADLIIAEDSMPLMGGAKLCAAIRNDALLKNVSIIMICGDAKESAASWHAAGANAVVQKPADPAELFSKISELLVIPQRKDLRVPLRALVTSVGEKTPFLAETRNISISGMLLETDRVLQEGDRLTCTFNIAHNKIVAECAVVRMHRDESGRQLYGVTFKNPDMKSLIIIEQFVKFQEQRRDLDKE